MAGTLSSIFVGPEDAEAAVIWMHGLGASGDDFVPIVPELRLPQRPRVRFVFPHAPLRAVTINMGMRMRAWYDVLDLSLSGRNEDLEGIEQSRREVEALIDAESRRGIDTRRIVLAGFSQGGAMALHAGLRCQRPLAGIVALSCYLLAPASLEREASPANLGLPILQAHGTEDPLVPLAAGEQARELLMRAGYAPRWHTYPMPHAVHPAEIEEVGRFLASVLSEDRAPQPG